VRDEKQRKYCTYPRSDRSRKKSSRSCGCMRICVCVCVCVYVKSTQKGRKKNYYHPPPSTERGKKFRSKKNSRLLRCQHGLNHDSHPSYWTRQASWRVRRVRDDRDPRRRDSSDRSLRWWAYRASAQTWPRMPTQQGSPAQRGEHAWRVLMSTDRIERLSEWGRVDARLMLGEKKQTINQTNP
jgi:hypothetical protein